jgi:Zn-dependent protease with chaperone function
MTASGDPADNPAELGPAERQSVPATGGRQLLMDLPWFLVSLVIASIIGTMPGYPWGFVVIAVWLLSGAVVLWPATERLLTRYALRLREPTGVERERLSLTIGPVAHVAGVDDSSYTLRVRDAEEPVVATVPGSTVAVSRWAATSLPPRLLEAVLAREVGRRRGTSPRLSLLAYWYSIPARLLLGAARGLVRAISAVTRAVPAVGRLIAIFLLICWLGMILTSQIRGEGTLGLVWYITPVVAPVLLAWFSRYAEKRADRASARLGYGASLVDVFNSWQAGTPSSRLGLLAGQPSAGDRARSLERSLSRIPRKA